MISTIWTKPIKANKKAFHSQRINLDFDMSQFIFHAIMTKIQVFEVARGFRNWLKNDKNCRIKVNWQQLLFYTESFWCQWFYPYKWFLNLSYLILAMHSCKMYTSPFFFFMMNCSPPPPIFHLCQQCCLPIFILATFLGVVSVLACVYQSNIIIIYT